MNDSMMTNKTDVLSEVSEAETLMSALLDGESPLMPEALANHAHASHQYFYYQLIRQTLRGVAMTSDARESVAWSQTRFTRLWARVDTATKD